MNLKINIQQVIQTIEKYEIVNPFPAIAVNQETNNLFQRGIMCCQCEAFDLNTITSYMSCDCGMHEPREMAIVRTICEYGVIHFDKELTTTELITFFDGDLERRTILKHLKKYFIQDGIGKATKFLNARRKFEEIIEDFSFKRSRYMKC